MSAARPELPADEAAARETLYPIASAIRLAYLLAGRAYLEDRTGAATNFGSVPIPRWDGGLDPATGRHFKPVWYDIARVAIAARVHLEDLVAAAFADWQGNRPPEPKSMANPSMAAWAREQADQSIANVERAWVAQVYVWRIETFNNTGMNNIGREAAARMALRDLSLPLSSVFRYSMATFAGDFEMAAFFEEGALRQYLDNRRHYDLGWKDKIPAQLREFADAASGMATQLEGSQT